MLRLSTNDFFMSPKNLIITEPRQPQPIFPEHCHDFNEIIIITSGHGSHVINDVPYDATSNEVFFVKSSDYHLFDEVNNLNLINVLYRSEFTDHQASFKPYFPQNQQECQWQIGNSTLVKITFLIQQLHQESHQTDSHSQLMAQALFEQLLILIWRGRLDISLTNKTSIDDKISLITKWLKENFQESLDLTELSEKYHVPLRTLHRKFKQVTGFSPAQYQHKIRINYASKQLLRTDDTITEIAFTSGYSDSNYFSTKFKQMTGTSPNDYRHQHRSI